MAIGDLISYEIGGGWGQEAPTDVEFEPAAVIRGTDMQRVTLGETSTVPRRFHRPSALESRLLRPQDIVFEVSGGSKDQPVGRALLVRDRTLDALENRAMCASFCKLIRIDPDLADPSFVFRFLQFAYIDGSLRAYCVQSTGITNFKWRPFLADFSVKLPDRRAQERVVEILDAIDDLLENTRWRIALLERIAQAIYREWFVHFRYPGHEDDDLVDSTLGAIPQGWVAAKTSELIEDRWLEIGDGYRAKNSEFSKDGVPFVRVGNMQGGSLQLQGSDLLPSDYVLRVGGKASQPGDCLISMKGTVGRVAFIGGAIPTVIYSPQVSYWRSLDESVLSSIYLRRWIQSDHFRLQCASVKGATDMADYVNLKDQRRMAILLPYEGVQRNFATVVGPIHDLADLLSRQASALEDLRDRLLPKLVTGAIDVSDLDLDVLLAGEAAA